MKKLLNTLYVTTQGTYLSVVGDTIAINIEGKEKLRIPVHTLGSVACFGNVTCSPFLMGMCAEHGIAQVFFTEYGRFLARVHGPVSGNVLLRKEQYRWSDSKERSAEIAQAIVIGKIVNTRVVIQRALRDREELALVSQVVDAVDRLATLLTDLREATDLETIRGLEGIGANIYFGVFDHLIGTNKTDFFFKERTRRPPLDNVNALLSFLYTLLVHDCSAALEGVGLDPAVGFLHRDRPGRPSLALDLMEELRAYMVDRLALSMINRQQISRKGFRKSESGAVVMEDDCRKEVLIAWQKRKQEEITHPFIDEKISIGLIPHVQAQLLARTVRGDLDSYPPFLWK
jgi:CRISPR-associated protein Cas1